MSWMNSTTWPICWTRLFRRATVAPIRSLSSAIRAMERENA
jgi:hypothetical protein